jgi:glycosyltransferase involved in cell wall biosynthesis
MRIGIAGRDLYRSGSGVGTYISNIVDHLIKLDKENEYVIFCRKNAEDKSPQGAQTQSLNSNNKIIWDYALLPRAVRAQKIDLLFCPKNVLPFGIDARSIITIHDLAYYETSFRAYQHLDTMYMRQMIRSSANRADGIIAISENTKQDIMRILSLPDTKVRVIHEAASEDFRPLTEGPALDSCRNKYDLKHPFFFFAGSFSPRKNLARTVRAFARVADQIPHMFVVTGSHTWGKQAFVDAVTESGVETRVKILGQVSEDDLIKLYNLADFCIYPSLYEGFGLPIVEAMTCGCPVACSNTTCLPEVAGNAGLLFDPLDENSIADAIIRLSQNGPDKDAYINKALNQAKHFSWQKTAAETLKYFAKVAAGQP